MKTVLTTTLFTASLLASSCSSTEANPSDQMEIIRGLEDSGFDQERFNISNIRETSPFYQGGIILGNIAVEGCDEVSVEFVRDPQTNAWLPDVRSDGKAPYTPVDFMNEFGC